jgi:hypothetical protein
MVHELRQQLLLEKHAAYIVHISQVSDQLINGNKSTQNDHLDDQIFSTKSYAF